MTAERLPSNEALNLSRRFAPRRLTPGRWAAELRQSVRSMLIGAAFEGPCIHSQRTLPTSCQPQHLP